MVNCNVWSRYDVWWVTVLHTLHYLRLEARKSHTHSTHVHYRLSDLITNDHNQALLQNDYNLRDKQRTRITPEEPMLLLCRLVRYIAYLVYCAFITISTWLIGSMECSSVGAYSSTVSGLIFSLGYYLCRVLHIYVHTLIPICSEVFSEEMFI